jgi:hypothetical protein
MEPWRLMHSVDRIPEQLVFDEAQFWAQLPLSVTLDGNLRKLRKNIEDFRLKAILKQKIMKGHNISPYNLAI